jgi:hypothetical protein
MKALRRYSWQLISTILALIAIFATYNVFFLGKPTKELQVIVDPLVSLVDVKPEAIQDIQVLYRGEPVSKVFLLQIRIKNAGNQPIATADYSRPLSFTFSPDYKLADATVTSSNPPNLGMTISKISEQKALVSTTLLNPDDSVSVRFILVGDNSETLLNKFSIDGRISGIREIKLMSSVEQKLPDWVILATGAIGGAIFTVLRNLFSDKPWIFLRRKKSVYELECLPLDDIVVAEDFARLYPDLQPGKRDFNGIPFLLSRQYFDTSATPARVVQLRISKSVTGLSAVHILINAGNAWKRYQNTDLSGVVLGRIILWFTGEAAQEIKLVLGENIREWAPGHQPGELVDQVTNPLSREAWASKKGTQNLLVIDHLEIPVQAQYRSKALERIEISRDTKPNTPEDILSFCIFAITLEH